MTPEEKAKQLIGLFYLSVTNLKEQKKCALMVVDEIDQVVDYDWKDVPHNRMPEYWKEVIEQINIIE